MNDDEILGSSAWRDRPPLSDPELADLAALRWVCGRPDPRVQQVGDQYVDNQRPVLPFLADGMAALIEVGHLRLGEPDPASGAIRPVLVTASGRARYEQLCDRQGLAPYPAVIFEGMPGP